MSIAEALKIGTGAGVKIGILDTGIADLPGLRDHVAGHFQIVDQDGQISVVENATGFDDLSHGTAIADIIHRYAPDAILYDVKLMDYKSENSRYKLASGIRFGTERGWDILNLSVGTQVDFPRLREMTGKALAQNIMILSAIDCDRETIGFPAAYPGVISVDYDLFDSPLDYKAPESADICGHGIFVEAANARGVIETYTGSSFASPHIAALAARARQFFPGLTSGEFLNFLRGTRPDFPQSSPSTELDAKGL